MLIQERSKFKSLTEARDFYQKQANALVHRRGVSLKELFEVAELAPKWDDDLAEAHYLWTTLQFLNSKIIEVPRGQAKNKA